MKMHTRVIYVSVKEHKFVLCIKYHDIHLPMNQSLFLICSLKRLALFEGSKKFVC